MEVISYSQARNSFKAVLDQVVDNQTPTLIHRRDGEDAVLMSKSAYTSMHETMYLLSTPANARALMRSIDQHQKGKALRKALLAD